MLSPTSLLRRVKKPAKSVTRALQIITDGQEDGSEGIHQEVTRSFGRWTRIAVLVLLQVALGLTHETLAVSAENEAVSTLHSTSASFVALDTAKLVCSAVFLYLERRKDVHNIDYIELESEPLRAEENRRASNGNALLPQSMSPIGAERLTLGTSRSNIIIGVLSLFLVINSYITLYVANSELPDSIFVHVASILVPLFAAIFLRLFNAWTLSSQQWLGISLQILSLLSVESHFLSPSTPGSLIFLIAPALLNSLICIAIQHIYKTHNISIPNNFNTRLFAFSLASHIAILLLSNILPTNPLANITSRSSLHSLISLLLRASVDIASLNLIFFFDAVALGVTTSLSTSILFICSGIAHGRLSVSDMCSLGVAMLGFYSYYTGEAEQQPSSSNSPYFVEKNHTTRWLFTSIVFCMLSTLGYLGFYAFLDSSNMQPQELSRLDSITQARFPNYNIFADVIYAPPPPSPPLEPVCTRVPLPSEQYFSGNRTYHEFDDVLLIVFFSHARYDVNLDYYKEVYAEFFPNMVFIGPKSREDRGFEHSYDVLVDSYESEEDISDWNNYKMAGRMAHHMLYTALTTPPYSTNCYKGFLWAPFDTLLNIPRLQLFNQSRMWYFSPWGEYVPNPAMSEDVWGNASGHAPPARISPDPETDFESTHRGWWVDWWWGDPHYGIPTCKTAFDRIDPELRTRMASRFTHNETRYIGGSADTLYIPAHLKDSFIDVLGEFLNTTCFLEIAVPTAVHLVVPEDEEILFVDHWWIWNPPFNASFVRERWERGLEVDTFHTFHWGDKDPDGVWTARPENIEDVRILFRESAARQGVEWLSITETAELGT